MKPKRIKCVQIDCGGIPQPVDYQPYEDRYKLVIPEWRCPKCGRYYSSNIVKEVSKLTWSTSTTYEVLLNRALKEGES